MTTGMGRNANILYPLSVQLYYNLYRCNCQHLPMERKEVIVISLLVEEIALSDALILHHRFSEHGCDRNHSLFVILPVDDDIVLVNIFWLDTAKQRIPVSKNIVNIARSRMALKLFPLQFFIMRFTCSGVKGVMTGFSSLHQMKFPFVLNAP